MRSHLGLVRWLKQYYRDSRSCGVERTRSFTMPSKPHLCAPSIDEAFEGVTNMASWFERPKPTTENLAEAKAEMKEESIEKIHKSSKKLDAKQRAQCLTRPTLNYHNDEPLTNNIQPAMTFDNFFDACVAHTALRGFDAESDGCISKAVDSAKAQQKMQRNPGIDIGQSAKEEPEKQTEWRRVTMAEKTRKQPKAKSSKELEKVMRTLKSPSSQELGKVGKLVKAPPDLESLDASRLIQFSQEKKATKEPIQPGLVVRQNISRLCCCPNPADLLRDPLFMDVDKVDKASNASNKEKKAQRTAAYDKEKNTPGPESCVQRASTASNKEKKAQWTEASADNVSSMSNKKAQAAEYPALKATAELPDPVDMVRLYVLPAHFKDATKFRDAFVHFEEYQITALVLDFAGKFWTITTRPLPAPIKPEECRYRLGWYGEILTLTLAKADADPAWATSAIEFYRPDDPDYETSSDEELVLANNIEEDVQLSPQLGQSFF
eukprot:gb/GFBE01032062.1/.p1 GENE.gb/GFBE01032062.1/~~gb/GFBE01032062.1/.p1  ORF type:complete len:492 (+),score=115.32 gb/GFBE01032062.1/:1-1476(+)